MGWLLRDCDIRHDRVCDRQYHERGPVRTIGVISDTHGLLRDEAVDALKDSDLILHAGDVGGADILEVLAGMAPVFVVKGNNDHDEASLGWPKREVVHLSEGTSPVLAYMLHDISDLDLDPSSVGFAVVVYGHSHRPAMEKSGGVLYFNPGAAGHRRFNLPVTVGRLRVDERGCVSSEIIELEVPI